MPNFDSNTNHSLPAEHPDFTALALTLQETAQALFAFCPKNKPEELEDSIDMPSSRKHDGETRSYYFPMPIVQREKDLLHKYGSDNFQELLEKLHAMLIGLAKIMQKVHKDARVKGYVISGLGANLEQAAGLVLRMCHVYDRVMPVQK